MQVVRERLGYRRPFDGIRLLGYLAARAVPGVEEVAGATYRRSLRLARGAGVVELDLGGACGGVPARFLLEDSADLAEARARCADLLDLDADPGAVRATLGPDPLIGPLVDRAPGLRLPGSVDPAELAVRAVLGQQVSLAAARTLAGRLVTARGEALPVRVGAVTNLFPAASALASLAPGRLPMPAARARAVVGLSWAIARGDVSLGPGDPAGTRRALLGLPGIGPWTAGYIEMRALRNRDAFLPTDLGLRRALERLRADPRPAEAERLAERWRPYRAHALQYLWGVLA
ncbi:MAG TPA: AlkA N-terminal domain-containing protein [Solirubrobacterales bacterium]|nr:AlkA N-terminal domain-containing protein [Solirubrobacterales bacterium]